MKKKFIVRVDAFTVSADANQSGKMLIVERNVKLPSGESIDLHFDFTGMCSQKVMVLELPTGLEAHEEQGIFALDYSTDYEPTF